MNLEDYLSLKEYAKEVGVLPATVRQKILRGNLEAVKVGRDWFVKKETPYNDARIKSGKYKNWRKK